MDSSAIATTSPPIALSNGAKPAIGSTSFAQKVKIGLVGLNFGRTILSQLEDSNISRFFDVSALCDRDEAILNRTQPPNGTALYRSLDELLDDPAIEAVGLFTGPVGRADLIQKIIDRGRHVITTKPLELNADALLKTLRNAAQLGCVVHANSPGPLPTPDLEVIQRWVQQHDLGRPVGAFANVWVSYREKEDGSWYDQPPRCPVAPIYRLGIYLINDLVRLWGPVKEVQVQESRIFTGRPTSDNAQLGLLFRNQAVATVYASFCVKDGDHYRNGLTLNFENGTIYRNTGPAWSLSARECCHLALVKEHRNKPRVFAQETVINQSGSYQWEYFARRIRGEIRSDELTPEQMVEGIRVVQAMARESHFD